MFEMLSRFLELVDGVDELSVCFALHRPSVCCFPLSPLVSLTDTFCQRVGQG